jgi:hypothetical protein
MRSRTVDTVDLHKTLLTECRAMIQYAAARGIETPQAAVAIVDRAIAAAAVDGGPPFPLAELSAAHHLLAQVVVPATPETIQTIAEEHSSGPMRYLGATNYARGLSVLAVLAFIAFVTLQGANTKNWPEVITTALASVIGGIFYVMFALSRRLADGTFNRSLEGQYTILIILGGLAGTALAFLIVRPTPPPADNVSSAAIEVLLTRPLLALLGGFSARAVYRVLERLVETVEAMIKGSGDDMVAAQKEAIQARATAETLSVKTRTLQQLIALSATAPSEGHRTRINDLIDKLLEEIQQTTTPPTPPPSIA